jgi:hypothetical protein
MNPESELHRADPRLRQLARWLPALILVAALLGLWWLDRWLGSLDGQVSFEGLLLGFLGLAAVIATAGLTLAWTLWNAASRIVSEDRYPTADMRTLRDVPLRRGQAARTIASRLRAAAVLAALLGIGILVWALLGTRALV